jgi:hypothetical protein
MDPDARRQLIEERASPRDIKERPPAISPNQSMRHAEFALWERGNRDKSLFSNNLKDSRSISVN